MAKREGAKFPLGAKEHLPQDVLEAVQFVIDREPDFLEFFWPNQIESPEEKAARRQKTTEKWGNPCRQSNRGFKGN